VKLAVNVRTGNFTYFDSRKCRITVDHVMASGALPPGLPPVEIDGEYYWDGGIVSNTPLQHILDNQDAATLVFQVDLFPAEGAVPTTWFEAAAREKDIRFSSRTRLSTDMLLQRRRLQTALRTLLDRLPPDLREGADFETLCKAAEEKPVSVVHLIHRSRHWQSNSKDYEFSRRSMLEHWAAGNAAVRKTMHKSGVIAHNLVDGGTAAFDLTKD
jgi:NTE family protein